MPSTRTSNTSYTDEVLEQMLVTLEELLAEQRRAANYLAFFAWITAISIILGVGSGVVWYLATR